MDILPQLFFVFLLIFLNGFFVASEFSLVAVRKTRIQELVKQGNKSALLVQKALENLDHYISATQLGITLVSIALGWIGEPVLAKMFEGVFAFFPEQIAFISAHVIASLVAFLLITFLHIVVFKLGDIPVENIMVHRTEIIALKVSSGLNDIFTLVKDLPYSRFPVYESSVDTIIGFVHIRDIYKAFIENPKTNIRLSELPVLRKIISVPHARRADDVLVDMRRKRIHIAVVTDEYGGTAGIITLEDIIENVVGDIHDEFEMQHDDIREQEDKSYLIEGSANIERVKNTFAIPMRGHGYTTIGGLIFGLLGREPRVGDTVQIGNVLIEVVSVEGRKIKLLRLKKIETK